uniref:Beta-lactamase-related domain-containing protein n=1 Tax=Bionectria ochroleuca TaxID=29856 RepID=A0A8H7KAL5_BIOOC
MAEIDAILQKYTDPETGSIHGASFVAVDANGNDIYRKSFGHQKVDVKNSPPLTLDTVTWIASQTKLTTSVSVMQIVERGLIGLDDDVREVLPQLKELKVLVAFEDEDGEVVEPEPTSHDNGNGPYINRSLPKPKGQPIFEDVKGPITLRHLVTHTSGLCYDLASPLLMKYSAWIGRQENMFSGTIEGFFHPLLFQPGYILDVRSWA